jgi:hypothetical protein
MTSAALRGWPGRLSLFPYKYLLDRFNNRSVVCDSSLGSHYGISGEHGGKGARFRRCFKNLAGEAQRVQNVSTMVLLHVSA